MARFVPPFVMVIGGINGAGKTTAAESVLCGELDVAHFLNADLIAKGLSPFNPALADITAGEILLKRLEDFGSKRESFGIESTLAGRSLARRLSDLQAGGFQIHLVYVYLRSSDLAIERVATRVKLGGHHVDEATIRRRYDASVRNFFTHYRPLAATWTFLDNSELGDPQCLAKGAYNKVLSVEVRDRWEQVVSRHAGK